MKYYLANQHAGGREHDFIEPKGGSHLWVGVTHIDMQVSACGSIRYTADVINAG